MIDKTIAFQSSENEHDVDFQSLPRPDILRKLEHILNEKGQIDTERPKTVENLKALENEYAKKVRELE